MRIVLLPSGTVTSSDQIAIDNSTNGARKVGLQSYVQDSVNSAETSILSSVTTMISTAVTNDRPIHVSEAVTSLPKTISDARITADHYVVDMKFIGASSPFSIDWTTASGSVDFALTSGTFSSCTFDFELERMQ